MLFRSTLFANILQNPTSPTAVPDIALMHCVTSILTTNFSAASNPRSSIHLEIFKQILSVAANFVAKARGEAPDKYEDLEALKLPENYLQMQSVLGSTSEKGWGGATSSSRRGGGRIMKLEDGPTAAYASTSTSASYSGNENDDDNAHTNNSATTPGSGGGSQDLNKCPKNKAMHFMPMPPVDTPSPAPPPYIPCSSDVSQTPGAFSSHQSHIPAPPGLLNACGGGTGCYLHPEIGRASCRERVF